MFTSSFNLDLSEASIIEIIDAFVDFKRKFNPNYNSLNLRSVILRAEETFKCTLKVGQSVQLHPGTVGEGISFSDIKIINSEEGICFLDDRYIVTGLKVGTSRVGVGVLNLFLCEIAGIDISTRNAGALCRIVLPQK